MMFNSNVKGLFLFVLGTVAYIFSALGMILYSVAMYIFIFINLLLVVLYTFTSAKSGDFLQPSTIFNMIYLLVFVVRAMIVVCNLSNLSNYLYFTVYGSTYDFRSYICKALFLGMIGIYIFNTAYFYVLDLSKNRTIKRECTYEETKQYVCLKRREMNNTLFLLYLFSSVEWVFFVFIFIVRSTDKSYINTINLLWCYILYVIIMFDTMINTKIRIRTIVSVIMSIATLTIVGNRQIIINLLLCLLLPYYYVNNKKISSRLIILGVLGFIGIVVVSDIRYGRAFSFNLASLIDKATCEFGMFDMLVISLREKEIGNLGFYWGYNYLNFFTFFIPGLDILPFDWELVKDVFQGKLGGGIPVTLIGSFYMNFSYLGLVLLSVVFGSLMGIMYKKQRFKGSFISIAKLTLLSALSYDLARVGDIGREIIIYLFLSAILWICSRILPRNTHLFQWKSKIYFMRILSIKRK